MNVEIDNNYSKLYNLDKTTLDKIIKKTSYRIKNYQFMESYKLGRWDGYVRLLRWNNGKYSFPTGLLVDIIDVYKKHSKNSNIEVIDNRRDVFENKKLNWNKDYNLREYQIEALQSVFDEKHGVISGRGILKLPIRSGKTVIAAALIRQLGLRSVFVVTSQLILNQTIKLFEKIFNTKIGQIGENIFDPAFITVASIQSLMRLNFYTKEFLDTVDVLIVDEVHHLKGNVWRKPILYTDARYKIGLSATVEINKSGCELGSLWFKSSTGPILIDLPMKRLIRENYILAPKIIMINVSNRNGVNNSSWQTVYKKLIVNNDFRNQMIIDTCKFLVANNHKVLIDTGRLRHIKQLYSLSYKNGLKSSILYGNTKSSQRREIIDKFKSGKMPVIIGTVMGEGVDIPELSAVINAEGGKSQIATLQRMRNLTFYQNKPRPIVVDFFDNNNRYLHDHSQIRLNTYKNEPAFLVIGPIRVDDFFNVI